MNQNKTSEIKFTVQLDGEKLPVSIEWNATDAGLADKKSCKSVMISIFDTSEKSTLRIDLWTKDMLVDEMKRFFYETMVGMADTFERATGDKEAAGEMKKFSGEFAKKTGVIK